MTRVLHLATVDWQVSEGIARACRETAAALSEDVTSFLVVDRDPLGSAGAFAEHRVVPHWSVSIPWRPGFARAVKELRPDVVHIHGGSIAPLLAYAPALRELPVVVTCYHVATMPHDEELKLARLREHGRSNVSLSRTAFTALGGLRAARRALRTGRVAVICTPDAKVEANFAGAGPVVRASGAASPSPYEARWSPAPIVVFAGRAEAARGVDDLVAAFPRLLEQVPRARLRLLLLPGPEAARWASSLRTTPWADVYVGAVPDLPEAMAACQVGAFPFRWSVTMTPALAAAEAMALGLPIVATTVDCLDPLVQPGVNGWLVPPNEPGALADALARVLAGPETWGPLAVGARKSIEEHWSWTAAAEVIRRAYTLALARSRER